MSVSNQYDIFIKLIVLGDMAVGKSCFLLRFAENNFQEGYIMTVGFDYKNQYIEIDGKKVKVQVWDTTGQERFMSITKNMFLRTQGIILMYDITRMDSFKNISKWLSSLREVASPQFPLGLVGNKCDMEDRREVSYQEGEQMAKENNLFFLEASAKENINVKEIFVHLSKEVINQNNQQQIIENKNIKDLTKVRNKNNQKKKCCN